MSGVRGSGGEDGAGEMPPSELVRIGESRHGRWGWQRRLAAEMGVNENTVRRWKSGHSPINANAAFRLRRLPPAAGAPPFSGDPADLLRRLAREPWLRVEEVEVGVFRLVPCGAEKGNDDPGGGRGGES